MTLWLGGLGIVLVAVAPTVGAGAACMLGAQFSGLTHTRLTPRITDTAKVLTVIYLTLSVTTTLALLLAEMSFYSGIHNY